VWSWDGAADQVALVVQNIQHSLAQYNNMYWSIPFNSDLNENERHGSINCKSTACENFLQAIDANISLHPCQTILAYFASRDQNILQEIYKFGWYIDYWLENGLLRDVRHSLNKPSLDAAFFIAVLFSPTLTV
jgi:hypothetical protein